jgi:hypothetical protein
MVLFAFSLQDQVEKYGAYVAIGCFFGLAVLSLLYFAQARELRRLRDWAGRSPEFAWDELERRVLSLESRRAAPAPRVAAAAPVPAMAATNGAHKLKPEQVAALAFARAAGVAEPPHPPKPAAVPAAAPVAQPVAVAVQDPPQTAVEAVPPAPQPEPEPEPAPVTGNGNGTGHGDVPAPLTSAGRRPPAQPLRRPAPTPAPARRMPSGPPARRETSVRSVILISLLGLVVVAGVAFGAKQLLSGGGDDTPPPQNHVVDPATGEQTSSGGNDSGGSSSKPKASTPPPRNEGTVMVLNGTVSDGLAADTKDQLVNAGYTDANVDAGNDPRGRGVTTSVVYYKRGASAQAKDVAKVLDISSAQVKPIDATLQQSAPNKSVVVEIGADKSGN